MDRKVINLNRVLTFLAIAGILSGIYMLRVYGRPAPISYPIISPTVSPFDNFIAGPGLVEAASENIEVGTMVGGVVEQVLVERGDKVSKGHPLFILDSRQALAEVKVKEALLETSKTALNQAQTSLASTQHQLDLVNKVSDKRGVTKEELITRQDNVLAAQKAVENAKASVEAAEAQLKTAQTLLSFYTIKAPINCEIMQVNIRPGEYAPTNIRLATPLMLIGDVSRYHLRVNVDENNAWRFRKDEPAVAFLRGNPQYHTSLKFEYIEPYMIPKRFFTGDSTERVDTRVLQVVYSYDPQDLPSYLGQELDVYIRAAAVPSNVQYGGPLPVSK